MTITPFGSAIGLPQTSTSGPGGDDICMQRVLDTYSDAMKSAHGKQDAFNAAVRVWRKHNPNASPEMAGPAVATILCQKL